MTCSLELKNDQEAEAPGLPAETSVARGPLNHARTLSLPDRLAEAAACLEQLDQERASCADPAFGKAIEEKIVARELLDLELQEFDEQIESLSNLVQDLRNGGWTTLPASSN